MDFTKDVNMGAPDQPADESLFSFAGIAESLAAVAKEAPGTSLSPDIDFKSTQEACRSVV
jgi:hypothetical protein